MIKQLLNIYIYSFFKGNIYIYIYIIFHEGLLYLGPYRLHIVDRCVFAKKKKKF